MLKIVLIASSLIALQSLNTVDVESVASKSNLLNSNSTSEVADVPSTFVVQAAPFAHFIGINQHVSLDIKESLVSENITTPVPGAVATTLVAASVAVAPFVKDKIFHGHAIPENLTQDSFDY